MFFMWHLLSASATFAQGSAAAQRAADDAMLQDYFKAKHIRASSTPSGLYYTIKQEGTGTPARAGQEVTMNYTGRLLNGKAFDSNIDPKFRHTQPFTFVLGKGDVISGWDIGVQLFNQGTIATLYIPSGLAYGSQGSRNVIPPNAILVFDVELTDIEE